MSQLTRLRVMDALVPGVFYTFQDISAEVDAPEDELRKAVTVLTRNKALRYWGNTKPVGYERPIQKPKRKDAKMVIADVFGCHRASTKHEAKAGEVIRNHELRNGHRKALPPDMDREAVYTKRQQWVMSFIAANPGCRRFEICRGTGLSDGYLGNLLSRLKQNKQIRARRDVRQGNHTYSRYWMAEA